MTGQQIRERIEAVHERHTGKEDPHGALAWFGRLTRRTRRTVWRWCNSDEVEDGPHLRVLQVAEIAWPGTPWLADPKEMDKLAPLNVDGE